MKIDKSIFRWDSYSDQPATLDKGIRRTLLRHSVRDELRKLRASVPRLFTALTALVSSRRFDPYFNEGRIGLCINLERPLEDKRVLSASDIREIIRPLNLSRIAVRIPLHDVGRLEDYVQFIRHFSDYELLAVILQDREFIEDKRELESSLRRIFVALSGIVERYQIGNATNRVKWGFVSQREYLEFFEVAWRLRNRCFPDVQLLGGAVIDFDLHEYCGSLYNGFPFEYDGYASLLYVDRRGAPERRQFGFSLPAKIDLIRRLAENSRKLSSREEPSLWITEINWPLRETGRYAPSLDDRRVGESEQLHYLVRYFLLALGTGSIRACFWHQLVAPGYGLVDNRGGAVRLRPAFFGFATLCRLFNGARIEDFRRQEELGHYRLAASRGGREIEALWCCGRVASIVVPSGKRALDIEGREIEVAPDQPLTIGDAAIYLVDSRLQSLDRPELDAVSASGRRSRA